MAREAANGSGPWTRQTINRPRLRSGDRWHWGWGTVRGDTVQAQKEEVPTAGTTAKRLPVMRRAGRARTKRPTIYNLDSTVGAIIGREFWVMFTVTGWTVGRTGGVFPCFSFPSLLLQTLFFYDLSAVLLRVGLVGSASLHYQYGVLGCFSGSFVGGGLQKGEG